jgi:rhodanese-related sulfurtransferase
MTPAELVARIASGTPPVVLDVRSRAEFERGHVPGALHAPFLQVRRRARALQLSPGAELVVYCGHGPRARIAAAVLSRAGFSRVQLLDGHWAGWTRAGLSSG